MKGNGLYTQNALNASKNIIMCANFIFTVLKLYEKSSEIVVILWYAEININYKYTKLIVI